MRIALVTEAWHPQVNGVVTTWTHVIDELSQQGHEFFVVHAGMFRTAPFPRYPDIRIALLPGRRMARMLDEFQPDAIHVATEGPLGWSARRYCMNRNLPFTTSYHTQFPDYFRRYFGVPQGWTFPYFRRFHAPAKATLVPTPRVKEELDARGFKHVVTWSRGVDANLFAPIPKPVLDLPRPVFACAGRVCLEKNLDAFLKADLPGSKLVIGPGPLLPRLKRQFPEVRFTGYLPPVDFARHIASADVFVFPSRTDTFGLVMLEAMACGVPVAAYPVTGPIDVVKHGVTGVLHTDLRQAAVEALDIDRDACRRYATQFSWSTCANQLYQALATA
jgi:glycosyltransferase involved in cell wall biosynthesis